MSRYLALLRTQLRASMLVALQYRADFALDAIISIFWTATAIIPLLVVFDVRSTIAGWSAGEALLVVGWFTLLQGIMEGAINPSLTTVVEHIRKGTLDFVLLKPADAQFLVSTARFLPWRATNIVSALIIFAYAFHELGRTPSATGIVQSLFLLVGALLILYSLWILTVSAAFYVIRVDNLTYLFGSIFDAARWPSSVFRGVVGFVFTFVIPLAVMTTFPARALLDRLPASNFALSFAGAITFATLARFTWVRSIRRYTSASS